MSGPDSKAEESARGAWAIFVLLFLAYTLNYADRQLPSVVGELIKRDLGLSDTAIGFFGGIGFSFFNAFAALPLAFSADRWSRRWVLVGAVTVWSGMTAVTAGANSFLQLFLARIGVGVAESGCSAPSHAVLSERFPAERRGAVLALFQSGASVGAMAAFLIGSVVAQAWGWRWAFIALGIPGLVLAPVLAICLPDDRARRRTSTPVKFADAARDFVRNRLLVRNALAFTFQNASIGAWGLFFPAFLMRQHHATLGEIGPVLGLAVGAAGGLGTFLGGVFADSLARRDARGPFWVCGGSILVGIGFSLASLFVGSLDMALILAAPAFAFSLMHVGPTYAIAQSAAAPHARATVAALTMLVMNVVGTGLGPIAVGVLSDALTGAGVPDALRIALTGISLLSVIGGLGYFVAARALPDAPLPPVADGAPFHDGAS